jgi:uncharacterized protein (DUF342 family)
MPWQLQISSDKMTVRLDMSRCKPDENIDSDDIKTALEQKQIPWSTLIEERVREIIENLKNPDLNDPKPVLIQATPPIHGEDARFEWSKSCDPDRVSVFCDRQDQTGRASFYDRSSVILVAQDEIIGILHPPTKGEAGKDVFGDPVESRPGAEYKIEAGKNVRLQSDGQTFIALCDGEPKLQGKKLMVEPVISIKSDVDFSTGNIDYRGDVHVNGDVKDLFEVKAGGNIYVGGTIEAANIECGGNLIVRRGIAGKEKGSIVVKKNLTAKYLSNVTVWVQGDALIKSEIVNVELNSKGKVVLERGGISGGQIIAAGDVESPVIGSPAGVRTVVKAAVDPFLQKKIREYEETRVQLLATISKLMPKAKALLESSGGNPSDPLKEIAENIQRCKEQIEEIDKDCETLTAEMAKNRTGKIIVHKMIYPGAILFIGDSLQMVHHEITGPLEVVPNRTKEKIGTLDFRSPAEAITK